jgi:hypothetical protein
VKAYNEAEVWLYSFLNSALDREWMVSLTPRPSYPKERVSGSHWIRGWVGSTTSVYCCRREKSAPAWIQTPDRPLSRFINFSSHNEIKYFDVKFQLSRLSQVPRTIYLPHLQLFSVLLHNGTDISKVSVRLERLNSLNRWNT